VANVVLKEVKIIRVECNAIAEKAMTTTVSTVQLNLRDIALGTPIPCDLVATLLSDGEASKALPKLTGMYDLTVDMARDLVEMAAQLNLLSLQAMMKGTVHNVRAIPQFDLHLTTNRFSPGELLAPLPMLMSMLLTPAELCGSVQLQATLEGTPHNRHSEAEMDLDNRTLKSGFFNGGILDGDGRFLVRDVGAKSPSFRGISCTEACPMREEPVGWGIALRPCPWVLWGRP
jgi:hypothetical protein